MAFGWELAGLLAALIATLSVPSQVMAAEFMGSAADPIASAAQPGFQESIVLSGLTDPMALRFARDGRVFVAEKSGLIKVFNKLTDPSATPSLCRPPYQRL
jgi:hypothetical protein